jgi:hypothetical protein
MKSVSRHGDSFRTCGEGDREHNEQFGEVFDNEDNSSYNLLKKNTSEGQGMPDKASSKEGGKSYDSSAKSKNMKQYLDEIMEEEGETLRNDDSMRATKE